MGFFKPNIEKMEAEKDIEGLTKALRDNDGVIRQHTIEALGNIGGVGTIEPLIRALREDKHWYNQEIAAKALANIGEPSIESLIKALEDESVTGRPYAARALGKIGDARAVEPLIKALEDEEEYVRLLAAEALGNIGDARAVKPLVDILKDERDEVHDAVWEALDDIEVKNQGKLISRSMLYLLVLIHDEEPTQGLIEELSEELLDHYGRKGVVMLGGHKTTSHLPQEPDAYVVTACLKACTDHNIAFDSDRDEIAYSIDNVCGEEIGVCKIHVHSG